MWADLWNDTGALTDVPKYRDAIYKIFILGEEVEHDDDDDEPAPKGSGPRPKPLSKKPVPTEAMRQLREMRERMQQRQEKAD